MNLSGVEQFLWAATFLADCLLLAVLVMRRRAAGFPVFSALIGLYVARTAVLYLLARRFGIHTAPYFYTYWSLAFVDEALQLVVFYELAVHVFCPTGVWARDVHTGFVWLAAASALVALALTLVASPSAPHRYQGFLLRSNFFSFALMSELFVGTMVLSATAGLPWKTHVARIAQGFGAYALIGVVLEGASNYFGLGNGSYAHNVLLDTRQFAYLGCAAYWIVTLWLNAPAPRELPDALMVQIYTLQRQMENDLVRIRNWRQW